MKSSEIIKRLKNEGWFIHHTRGDPFQFKHPEKIGKVTVPHPKKRSACRNFTQYIPTGTLEMEVINMIFPIIIHKDADSDYGVSFPDFPGCFSAGSTIEEAIEQAHEAALCHIEGLLIDSEPIPKPTNVERYLKNPDYSDGFLAIVKIDPSQIRMSEKISFPLQ